MEKPPEEKKFEFTGRLEPEENERIIPIIEIPEDCCFSRAEISVKILDVSGGGNCFGEVSLQVGYDDNWASWVYVVDVFDPGDEFHVESVSPPHQVFKKARLRIAKIQDVGLRVSVEGFVAYSKIGEVPPEEQPPEEAPPEEQPPEEQPPEEPEEPFDVGKWIERGLRKILRDEEPPSCKPHNTQLLVSLLAVIYMATLANIDFWVEALGLLAIPTVFLAEPWRIFTHMWLHYPGTEVFNGFVVPHAHIAMNVLFLWVFGDNVECRLGHGKYLAYYLVLGVLAGLGEVLWLHVVGLGLEEIYIIGASGAISGILGMYLVFFPRNNVVFLGKKMKSYYFLVAWFLEQVAMLFAMDIGVAVAAHITGFIAGAAVAYAEKSIEEEVLA